MAFSPQTSRPTWNEYTKENKQKREREEEGLGRVERTGINRKQM
jgi:hypothetical protein